MFGGEWALKHTPGTDMIADLLTKASKALSGLRLLHLKALMGMWIPESGGEIREIEQEQVCEVEKLDG